MVATFTKDNLRNDEEYITIFGVKTLDNGELNFQIIDGGPANPDLLNIGSGRYPRVHKAEPKVFHKTLSKSIKDLIRYNEKKKRPDNSWRVTLHNVEEYNNTENFTLNESTFAISKDGDIISVSKNPNDYFPGSRVLKYAVKHGGKKLDSYDGNNIFYQKCGFEPIAACKGVAEYEPNGIERVEDIIFYRYNPDYKPDIDELDKNKNGDSSLTIKKLKKAGAYFRGANGYDKAKAYRDKNVEV